jgi:hypothetical protein
LQEALNPPCLTNYPQRIFITRLTFP